MLTGSRRQQVRGIDQPLGGGELAFGVNDLRPLLALCFGLLGHGAQHRFRHIDLLDFNVGDFHAPGRGMRVENALQTQVDFVAMSEQFVEFLFAEHRPQRGLRELRGLIDVV